MKSFPVIALSALCLSCSEKGNDGVWWENEKTIIELTKRLELEQFRAKKTQVTTETVNAETVDIVTNTATIESEISQLVYRKNSLEKELVELSDGWDTFRRRVLIEKRASVSGTSFQEFGVGYGKVYTNVLVTAIDDSGVAIRHSDGTARLRFNDLDADGHAFFGLEEEFAQDAIIAEYKQRIAYEKWIQKGMAAIEAEKLAAAKTRKREEEKRAEQRLLTARISALTAANTNHISSSYSKLGDTRPVSRRSSYYSVSRRSTIYRYYTPNRVSTSIRYIKPSTYQTGAYIQPPICNTIIYGTR
ncbi:MAG: hypothetical protein ACSHX9_01145 [Luteolibacter sp.]